MMINEREIARHTAAVALRLAPVISCIPFIPVAFAQGESNFNPDFVENPLPMTYVWHHTDDPKIIETEQERIEIMVENSCFSANEGRMDIHISARKIDPANKGSLQFSLRRILGKESNSPLSPNVETSIELSENKPEGILSIKKDIDVRMTITQKSGLFSKVIKEDLPFVLHCFPKVAKYDAPDYKYAIQNTEKEPTESEVDKVDSLDMEIENSEVFIEPI